VREKYCWLVAGLFWEKSTAVWWHESTLTTDCGYRLMIIDNQLTTQHLEVEKCHSTLMSESINKIKWHTGDTHVLLAAETVRPLGRSLPGSPKIKWLIIHILYFYYENIVTSYSERLINCMHGYYIFDICLSLKLI
jgi:hypothetical protein